MRTQLILAAGVLGLALAAGTPAEAQRQGGAGRGPGAMAGQRIGMIDQDGDGMVQRAELLDWRESVFYAMDADGDDTLTRAEFMEVRFGRGGDPDARGPRFEEMQAAKAAEFDAMDPDGDGAVDRETFLDHAAARFDAADADGDGALGPGEFRATHRRR